MALFPIPNPALGATTTENHIHDMEDVFGKCFQNTELRIEMKTLREMVAIQDIELKPTVRIIAFPGGRKPRQKLNS